MTTVTNVDGDTDMDPQELTMLYNWIDDIPLSRTKRNLVRDFSDGRMVAEVIHHMFPRIVDIHNYPPANSRKQKLDNWALLNTKVFSKLRFDLAPAVVEQIVDARPGVIERVLSMLKLKLERVQWDTSKRAGGGGGGSRGGMDSDRPEADQYSPGRVSSLKDLNMAASRGGGRVVTFAGGGGGGGVMVKGGGGGVGGGGGSLIPGDDSVPSILLEEKEHELLMKDETIHILQAKIKRLEHLLHLKDIRIEDLHKRIEAKQRMVARR